MKKLAVFAFLFLSITLSAQSKDAPPPQYIQTSGKTVTFVNPPGSGTITLEYLFTTGISAPTITVQGCGQGGTCTTLTALSGANPYTTATNAMVSFAGGYFQYNVTATYSGTGTITISFVGIQAKAGSGAGGGATFPTQAGVVCNTSITASQNCPSAEIQTAIGAGVYGAYGCPLNSATEFCITQSPYSATGMGATTTTTVGSFAIGTSGTVASCSTFSAGNGVDIAFAGAGGTSYIGTVVSCVGTTLTVTPATSAVAVTGVTVQHDETAAFQAAINAISSNGGTIWVPDGVYLLNGPLQDTTGANAVLTMPHIVGAGSAPGITIGIKGLSTPTTTIGTNGAILQTQIASGNLIGAYYNAGTYPGFTNVLLDLANLRFRGYQNPGIVMVNGSFAEILHAEHIWCDPNSNAPAQPTNTASACIKFPTIGNNVSSTGDDLSSVGFYTGFWFGEHDQIGSAYVANCHDAFVFDAGTDISFSQYQGNSISVDYLWDMTCNNGITGGSHPTTVNIQNADVELPITNTLYDPNSMLRGVINFANPYSPQTFTVVGGTLVQINNLNSLPYQNIANQFLTATNYINTTFNEGSSGTSIYGTAPAVNVPGGTWAQGAGGTGAATFNGSGATFAVSAAAILNAGTSNGTITFHNVSLASPTIGTLAVRLNSINTSGLVLTWSTTSGTMILQDFPLSGGTVTLATTQLPPLPYIGDVTFTLNGTGVSVRAFGTSLAGTIASGSSTLTQTYIRVAPSTGSESVGSINVNGTSSVCTGLLNSSGGCTSQGVGGLVTLAAGTATVSTAAACTPAASCSYKLTNCGLNGSTAIGTLSVGTVTAGTSFVINSLTAAAGVTATDTSNVCWKIN